MARAMLPVPMMVMSMSFPSWRVCCRTADRMTAPAAVGMGRLCRRVSTIETTQAPAVAAIAPIRLVCAGEHRGRRPSPEAPVERTERGVARCARGHRLGGRLLAQLDARQARGNAGRPRRVLADAD